MIATALATADARRTQLCGKRLGVGVELGIGERPVGPDDRHPIAVVLCRPRDPLVHAAELDRLGRRVVPLPQLPAIDLVVEANVPQAALAGVTGDLGQDAVEQLQAEPRQLRRRSGFGSWMAMRRSRAPGMQSRASG